MKCINLPRFSLSVCYWTKKQWREKCLRVQTREVTTKQAIDSAVEVDFRCHVIFMRVRMQSKWDVRNVWNFHWNPKLEQSTTHQSWKAGNRSRSHKCTQPGTNMLIKFHLPEKDEHSKFKSIFCQASKRWKTLNMYFLVLVHLDDSWVKLNQSILSSYPSAIGW